MSEEAEVLTAAPVEPAAPPVPAEAGATPEAERLAALMEQAEALIPGSRFALKMRDQASIVRGYAALFPTYEPGSFPWEHLEEIVARMRAVARCGKWLVPRDPPVPYKWVVYEEPKPEEPTAVPAETEAAAPEGTATAGGEPPPAPAVALEHATG